MTRVSLVCAQGHGHRYRATRLLQAGERLQPADFVPVDGQTAAEAGGTPACSVCGGKLVIHREPLDAPSNGTRATLPTGAHEAVVTLFEAARDEEVREMRPLPGDRLLVITSRRVIVVDLNRLLEDLPT